MNQKFAELLKKYLERDPDALLFALSFLTFAHAVDDIVDGDKSDKEFIIKTFELAAVLYSSPFYQKHCWRLYPVIKSVTNSYQDSVALEQRKEEWAVTSADVLRLQSTEVLVAIIEIVSGYEARRQASLEIRELGWKMQHI